MQVRFRQKEREIGSYSNTWTREPHADMKCGDASGAVSAAHTQLALSATKTAARPYIFFVR